jgi:hypothetical protein
MFESAYLDTDESLDRYLSLREKLRRAAKALEIHQAMAKRMDERHTKRIRELQVELRLEMERVNRKKEVVDA